MLSISGMPSDELPPNRKVRGHYTRGGGGQMLSISGMPSDELPPNRKVIIVKGE